MPFDAFPRLILDRLWHMALLTNHLQHLLGEIQRERPPAQRERRIPQPPTRTPILSWYQTENSNNPALRIAYRGPLSGPALRLHFGFDGWQEIQDVRMEEVEPGLAISDPIGVEGHLSVEGAVTDGKKWDNNRGADYRLWVRFEPIDSHLHVSGRGSGDLGISSLQTAMASAGIRYGIVSWVNNFALDRLNLAAAGLAPLVWIRPGDTPLEEVKERLADGYIGLKLHPTVDDYRADDPILDPYMEIAAEAGCPVACHSAPGDADPDHIRRLAERFPTVPVIFYHTYLGPDEGRWRAAQHVREQPNLYLETSWCRWQVVLQLIEEVGPDRILFGSDASVDGPHHYCRRPPNVEGRETYNEGLIPLIQAIGPEAGRKVLGDNARRLFRLKVS